MASVVGSKVSGSRVRSTPKSIATRQRIIEAAIRCFLDIGYQRTTTSEIAKQAKVTRGAVQYYFPTTPEVLLATVDHITQRFNAEFQELAGGKPLGGATAIDEGVDALWEVAHRPLWTAWKELDAAARTDAELRAIMEPAKAEFLRRWHETAIALYGSFLAADPVKFEMGHHLTWQFLQALAGITNGDAAEDKAFKARILAEFKRLLRHYWGLEGG